MLFRLFAFLNCLLISALALSVESRDNVPAEVINAFGLGLVKDINVLIPLAALTDNLVTINFDIKNPLPFEITLDSVTSSAGLNGTVLATFSHTFSKPGLVVPPLSTKNSGPIPNVLLVDGINPALAAVPFGILDLPSTNAATRALTVLGFGGIPVALNGLKQSAVPTNYTLDLS